MTEYLLARLNRIPTRSYIGAVLNYIVNRLLTLWILKQVQNDSV